MEFGKDQFISWIKQYSAEFIAAMSILILVLLIIFLKKQYVIAVIGMLAILAIGFGRRGKLFDRIVSTLVIFLLAFGFVLFD